MKLTSRREQIRSKSPAQLDEELLLLKKEQFNLRFQASTDQLENTSRVKQVRRDIARIKTFQQQYKLKQQENQE